VRPRSGLAAKRGVTVLNAPGTIDADYRGEVCVILVNLGAEPFVVERGERIAQLVLARHEVIEWEETAELAEAIDERPSKRPADSGRVKEELGDLLFSVCNLARHLGVDAESALEGTSAKFARRFREVEDAAKKGGRSLKDMSLAEMDELWNAAKKGG
jgi:uncharacterized protein YabN with tetrapyrrole methylase and pyrophosphatase domain